MLVVKSIDMTNHTPVHLLVLLDDLLPIPVGAGTLGLGLLPLQRLLLLALEARIGFANTHRTSDDWLTKTEVGLVKHVDCKLHRLRTEVDCGSMHSVSASQGAITALTDQRIALEVTLFILIEFYPWLVALDVLGDHSVPGEDLM